MTVADLALLLDHPGYRTGSLQDHIRFRDWVSVGVPPLTLLAADEYADLDPAMRDKYNLRREWHNFRPRLVQTPLLKAVRGQMDQRLAYNQCVEDGLKHMIIDGEGALGKSSAARDYAQHAYRRYFIADGEPSVPVVWVKVPAGEGLLPLLKAIADFVGCPFQARTVGLYQDLIAEFLILCRTRLLILDDAHRLNERRHSKESTINFLKWFSDKARVGYLITAVDLRNKGWYQDSFNDTQWWERVFILDVPRNLAADTAETAAWKGTVGKLEGRLLLMKHKEGTLRDSTELSTYLHARTEGRIGRLVELLGNAARMAILDGSERITRDLLEATTTSGVNHLLTPVARSSPAKPSRGAKRLAR